MIFQPPGQVSCIVGAWQSAVALRRQYQCQRDLLRRAQPADFGGRRPDASLQGKL